MMEVVSYSKLRQNLKAHIDRVCDDRAPLLVTRQNGDPVVMMSLAEYEELDETAYLLRNPANAEHLRASLAQAREGKFVEFDLEE